jgi:hypothetical protein
MQMPVDDAIKADQQVRKHDAMNHGQPPKKRQAVFQL